MQVCLLCVIANTEYEEMFPVARILRKAAMAEMVKLAQKFSSARGAAEVDEDMLRLYTQGVFELQQFEYKKMKLDACANLRSTRWTSTCAVKCSSGVWRLTCVRRV